MNRLHAVAGCRVTFLALAACLGVAGSARAQPFTDIGAALAGVQWGSQAWGDYDNDGDLDLLVTGLRNSGVVSKLYRNDGVGAFTDIGAGLTPVYNSSVAWGDYDRDGDLDILLTGASAGARVAKVYRNDGSTFTDIGAAMTGVQWGAVAWGDYDNDGDLDALITGDNGLTGDFSYYWGSTALYRNDGGAFTDIGAAIEGVYNSAVAWGDFDNDGDLDLVLAGWDNSAGEVARVYRNDGGGVFTAVANPRPVGGASLAWGDYDNDGDLDVFLSGWVGGLYKKVYRNDGGGVFTDAVPGLPDVRYATWGDADNDGDLDILGDRLVRNDGAEVFTDVWAVPEVFSESVALGDYDNDGDLDVLIAGRIDPSQPVTKVYRNEVASPNDAPFAPSSLTSSVGGIQVALSWAAASDAQTPAAGLSYNLRVGTSPGAGNVVSPMAAANGWRRIPAPGNAQLGRTAILESLAPGTYYWSVQAIDTSMIGSPFAAERSFTVSSAGCTYSLNPTSASVPYQGATLSASITTAGGCSWTAVSNDAWITFTTATSGSGNGTVGYSVATNPVAVWRTGSFTIAGHTLTVTQAPGCEYSLSPESVLAGASGGPGTVSVTAPSWCNWTAASNAAGWLTVDSGTPGSGSGTVGYSVAALAGGIRSGTLTIGTATFGANQIAVAAHELTHGSGGVHSLAADFGPVTHMDRYLVAQAPYSSYEVVVDGTSGDVMPIALERLSGDEAVLLQNSALLGVGAARSLRWRNTASIPVLDQLVRVAGAGCTTACSADDVYRIRLYETTGRIPRFNNSGSQTTVVILQNPGDATVSGSVHFWSGAGGLLASADFTIAAKGTFSLNTASLPALSGTSGSITVAHDASYGVLRCKAVSLEPATGFSFDSPLVWKPVR